MEVVRKWFLLQPMILVSERPFQYWKNKYMTLGGVGIGSKNTGMAAH